MSEAEDKIEGVAAAARKDSEEIPAWADALMKSHADVTARLDALMKERENRKDAAPDQGEDPTENSDGEKKDATDCMADAEKKDDSEREDRKDRKDAASETMEAADKAKDRADRARSDAAVAKATRDMQAKIDAMQHQLKALNSEPSIDDRNALADARSRADSLFQAALNRPVPEPLAGENPISYRRRLADALRRFSPTFAKENLGNLAGAVFDTVEGQIYADATAALKTTAIIQPGQLRAIRTNEGGHNVTRYVGDQAVTWGPFGYGSGGKVQLNARLSA